MFGPAKLWFEPTALNSNFAPVKANGEVLFLSVASLGSLGRESTPISRTPPFFELFAPPFSICSIISVNWSPKKIEIIAGGAS